MGHAAKPDQWSLSLVGWLESRLGVIGVVLCTALVGPVLAQSGPSGEARTAPGACIQPAASYHHVNPVVLRAILMVESKLKPDAVGRNSNGSIDVGIGQTNSIHFPELAKHGIGPQHLKDACVGTYVAAWNLSKGIKRYGNNWFGVAAYHSATPYYNKRYQVLVHNEMVRSGAIQGSRVPVPPIKPSTTSAGPDSRSPGPSNDQVFSLVNG